MSENWLELPELLGQIEMMSGLQLCLKALRAPVRLQVTLEDIPGRHRNHTTAFCRAVKVTRNLACTECDLRTVPQLALQKRRPFVNRCHARASEVIIPLIVRDQLTGLGYLGQFRESDDQPLSLPLYSPEQVQQVLALAVLLQRFYLYELERKASDAPEGHQRTAHIMRFLRRELSKDPSLNDLARELGISLSRTGHLVKELTGQTFVELKTNLKMEVAKELLLGTVMTVENIAHSTGFHDAGYFYRAFRKHTGKSPRQWRLEHDHARLSA